VVTPLSPRQREVLALIAAGYTNPSIAVQLGITLDTVKNHVEAILQRLGAENRGHAVLLAMQGGELR
jgi:DNA-binding NarL/FixJ family response regulator